MKRNTESLTKFVERSRVEALNRIEQLTGFLQNQKFDGLGFADFGAKIAFEEGKLEVLQHAAFLIEQHKVDSL